MSKWIQVAVLALIRFRISIFLKVGGVSGMLIGWDNRCLRNEEGKKWFSIPPKEICTWILKFLFTCTVLFKSPCQSTPRNHLCFLISSGPPLRLPRRLLRSDVNSFLTRSFAVGSKCEGNRSFPARIFS